MEKPFLIDKPSYEPLETSCMMLGIIWCGSSRSPSFALLLDHTYTRHVDMASSNGHGSSAGPRTSGLPPTSPGAPSTQSPSSTCETCRQTCARIGEEVAEAVAACAGGSGTCAAPTCAYSRFGFLSLCSRPSRLVCAAVNSLCSLPCGSRGPRASQDSFARA